MTVRGAAGSSSAGFSDADRGSDPNARRRWDRAGVGRLGLRGGQGGCRRGQRMTLDAQALALCARYEREILQAQSPCEVEALRRDLGEVIELLRTIGQVAIRFQQILEGTRS